MSIAAHEVTEGGEGAPELLDLGNVWLRWHWTTAVAWDDLPTARMDLISHCGCP